jgi:hypothetical protein
MITVLILSFCLMLTLAWAITATRYMYKFAKKIFMFEDEIEQSIYVLNSTHDSLVSLLKINVTADDFQTREVIANIKKARDSVANISNNLSNSLKSNNEEDTSDE